MKAFGNKWLTLQQKNTMKLSLIAATANNNAIGYRNQLLCHLPADLQHFKRLTTGHTILMGRRTFESLPNGALPNRRNIVISNSLCIDTVWSECALPLQTPQQAIVKKSLKEALDFCKNEEEVFVIGGESIYRQTIEIADTLHITHIHADFTADTFFPKIDLTVWQEKERFDFQKDEKNCYNYSFVKYERSTYLLSSAFSPNSRLLSSKKL
ncbi:dihydrofolate reductase [Bacteroidia bacterium]|nr:dihydrofolate reductase [Bacteroidia bacterium]